MNESEILKLKKKLKYIQKKLNEANKVIQQVNQGWNIDYVQKYLKSN